MNIVPMCCVMLAASCALGATDASRAQSSVELEYRRLHEVLLNDVEIDRWGEAQVEYQGPLRWLRLVRDVDVAEAPPLALGANDAALVPASKDLNISLDDRRLLGRIRTSFLSWRRMTYNPQWGRLLCELPPPTFAPTFLSGAHEDSPHGRKLYDMHALRPDAYINEVLNNAKEANAQDKANGLAPSVRQELDRL
jgi:hypothetical protein